MVSRMDMQAPVRSITGLLNILSCCVTPRLCRRTVHQALFTYQLIAEYIHRASTAIAAQQQPSRPRRPVATGGTAHPVHTVLKSGHSGSVTTTRTCSMQPAVLQRRNSGDKENLDPLARLGRSNSMKSKTAAAEGGIRPSDRRPLLDITRMLEQVRAGPVHLCVLQLAGADGLGCGCAGL